MFSIFWFCGLWHYCLRILDCMSFENIHIIFHQASSDSNILYFKIKAESTWNPSEYIKLDFENLFSTTSNSDDVFLTRKLKSCVWLETDANLFLSSSQPRRPMAMKNTFLYDENVRCHCRRSMVFCTREQSRDFTRVRRRLAYFSSFTNWWWWNALGPLI